MNIKKILIVFLLIDIMAIVGFFMVNKGNKTVNESVATVSEIIETQ